MQAVKFTRQLIAGKFNLIAAIHYLVPQFSNCLFLLVINNLQEKFGRSIRIPLSPWQILRSYMFWRAIVSV